MDITKASPKFLLTLAKNFVETEQVSLEEAEDSSFYESDDTTYYADKIRTYMKERGLTMYNDQDKFLYTFIQENMRQVFDGESNDYSSLIMPELRTYRYIWDTRQILTVNARYEHEFSSYLDPENAEAEVDHDRYNGNISPGDGREISYDILDSDLDEDSIERFTELK